MILSAVITGQNEQGIRSGPKTEDAPTYTFGHLTNMHPIIANQLCAIVRGSPEGLVFSTVSTCSVLADSLDSRATNYLAIKLCARSTTVSKRSLQTLCRPATDACFFESITYPPFQVNSRSFICSLLDLRVSSLDQ